ncbi:MAG: trigger factor [Planctomycetota bacterium]
MSTDTATNPEASEKPKLKLDIEVKKPQACLREVVVTIDAGDVQRYRNETLDEFAPDAQVPGFRAGRAPRRLIEKQFKDQVKDRVKQSLLMDSLSQITDSDEFSAISEPDFEYKAVEVPDEGNMVYQFQIEVRPEFDTPSWKGLALEKPVEKIDDEKIDKALRRVLRRYGDMEATDEPAELGDQLLVTAVFKDGEKTLVEMDEERITLSDSLSFVDGTSEDFGEKVVDASEGDTRTITIKMSEELDDEELRGKEVSADITLVEVFKLELPELNEDLLAELGDFDSEAELREFVSDSLGRQAKYNTNQALRTAIVEKLLADVDFELPEGLVRRQSQRELQRRVIELQRSGFDMDTIRNVSNALQQNARATTEAALREHFLLEQIAEEAEIDATEEEYDAEIELIAEQEDSSVRAVRAKLERNDQMDALRNQIVERKVIELVEAEGKVKEIEPDEPETSEFDSYAVEQRIIPVHNADVIPEAKYDDDKTVDQPSVSEKKKEAEEE